MGEHDNIVIFVWVVSICVAVCDLQLFGKPKLFRLYGVFVLGD